MDNARLQTLFHLKQLLMSLLYIDLMKKVLREGLRCLFKQDLTYQLYGAYK